MNLIKKSACVWFDNARTHKTGGVARITFELWYVHKFLSPHSYMLYPIVGFFQVKKLCALTPSFEVWMLFWWSYTWESLNVLRMIVPGFSVTFQGILQIAELSFLQSSIKIIKYFRHRSIFNSIFSSLSVS